MMRNNLVSYPKGQDRIPQIKEIQDIDFGESTDSVTRTVEMTSGDVSFTFKGGHTYEILEDGTQVMEYKTGPYEGVEKDKTFLKE